MSLGLNADIDGSLDMKASASGTLDSGKIKLFSVGIPGLDFPGYALNPWFLPFSLLTRLSAGS